MALGYGADISPQQRSEYNKICEMMDEGTFPKLPPAFQGECVRCHRRIPYGVLVEVEKWKPKNFSEGLPALVPSVMYCRQPCRSDRTYDSVIRRKSLVRRFPASKTVQSEENEVQIKNEEVNESMAMNREQLISLVAQIKTVLHSTNGKSSKRIAKELGRSSNVWTLQALQLMAAQKLAVKREGRWYTP